MRKALQSLRILIAEDCDADAELMILALRGVDGGVSVDVVSSERDFVSRIRENEYDAVLSDYRMGGWTALTALQILEDAGMDIPLVMVTGHLGDETAVDCIRKGVVDYVTKDRMQRLPLAVRKAVDEAELRRGQKALEQNVRLLASAVRSVEDGVLIVESGSAPGLGKVVFANRAASEISGYSLEELVAATLPERFISPSAPRLFDQMQQAMALQQTFRKQADHMRKDGTPYVAEWRISPIRSGAGTITHYACIHRDVTESTRNQKELEIAVADLARSNGDLTQFAYVASHDLREPLRMITSYLQLLERRYKDKLDADAIEFINFAVDGAKRMQQLTRDLLLYARVGLSPVQYSEVDCKKALNAAVSNLKMVISEQAAVITSDPLPNIIGNLDQLEQVLQNLIENSIRFRSEAPPKIHISAERGNSEWVFSVRDNGMGIAQEFHSRIFGLFQRLHGRGEHPGTGIGLAFCKQVIERQGGRMWLQSDPGRGSTFYFSSPDRDWTPSVARLDPHATQASQTPHETEMVPNKR